MKTSKIEVTYLGGYGSDITVVNAARVSFHKEAAYDWYDIDGRGPASSPSPCGEYFNIPKIKEGDVKLINYLAKHKHFSPFNHSFLSFRVKAPIFVARQLVKHKFLPWNEVSRRYVSEEPEFYFPDQYRKAAGNVKQGSSHEVIDTKWKRNEGTYSERRNPCVIKFSRLKWRCEAAGQEFNMEINDVEWNEVCPILGINLNYDVARGVIFDDTPAFDKIYPDKGYVKGNVRVISDLANRMKSSATPEQLEKFARAMLLEWKGEVGRGISPEGVCEAALSEYQRLLNIGVCAEQARMILPQNMMTEWIWSGTLGAFLDMLVLRLDPHTQKESRDVAELIAGYVQAAFPISYQARIHE